MNSRGCGSPQSSRKFVWVRSHGRCTDALNAMFSRSFQHVCKFPGVKPSSAMKVNAWICTCATDSDLERGLSKSIDVSVPKTVSYA